MNPNHQHCGRFESVTNRRDFLKKAGAGFGMLALADVMGKNLLLILSALSIATAIAAEPEFVDVFTSGTEGYPNYRIPALVVTKQGIVLALCEGRVENHDNAANDLVLKRSTDGGRTWTPLQLVRDEGKATCNDPVMTVLDTGRVLLFYANFPSDAHTREVVPGYDGKVSRHFVMHSDDEGKTWSEPINVTRQVKPAGVQASSQGAGAGLQLRHGPHAGRVLTPMWFRRTGEINDRSGAVAISDDRGETWHYSQSVPHGRNSDRPWHNISEGALVELADGRVMMSGRGENGPIPFFRKVSFSSDGGETWSECVEERQLPESQCQGSLLRLTDPADDGKSRILLSNPNSHEARKNGTIRLSYDEGRSWAMSKTLVPGTYKYSSLAALADGTILCLFEHGPSKTPKVSLARFSLDWLTDGRDQLP